MTGATILHITQRLAQGGAARSMLNAARHSSRCGPYRHRIASLLPAEPALASGLEAEGISILNAPDRDRLWHEMAQAGIVQVHFWNTPDLYSLLRDDLPSLRMLLRPHVGGLHAPQVLTRSLVDFADYVLTSAPFTFRLPVFSSMPARARATKVGMVYDVADFSHIGPRRRQPHDAFNVGYIGTLSPIKMHPNYVPMSAQIDIPNVRFVLCGGPAGADLLRRQAEALGIASRLDVRGYVEDIGPVLAELDVLGYPLCEDNYAAGELVLQEALYAGVPPVIFPYGGASTTVQHNETGIIVGSEGEYRQAIEHLYHHPAERERLATAGRAYARQYFGAANAIRQIHPVYEHLLSQPKRTRRLADVPPGASGAEMFVASLGGMAPQFEVSLRWVHGPQSQNVSRLLAAEQQIGTSSPVLCNQGGGGLFHYRNSYPQDGTLRLWSGLALLGQGQHVRALSEFKAARALGNDHWRVSWYLTQAAARLGARAVVIDELRTVVKAAPDLCEARQMLELWKVEG